MKIKFLQDYLGRETAMKNYKRGAVEDFPTTHALELIRLEVAEEVGTADKRPVFDMEVEEVTQPGDKAKSYRPKKKAVNDD